MSQQNSNNSNSSIPVSEVFWSLVQKADRKFSKIRNLAYYQRNRYDTYFYKVFKVYTQLWKFQQENRQKLVESGLKRWTIGEIASRIGQLYFGQYMRTSEASYLSESYIFYDAILTREYFKDGLFQDVNIANKQLRFIARFLMVCLILNRREKIEQLVNQLKVLLEECKKVFQATDFKEWKVVVQEIVRFLKADSTSMNSRPLRYSLVLDLHPDSLPNISASSVKKKLKLRDAILSSYAHNEVKFSELTLDTFRMLQCLEWEPSGSFYQSSGYKINLDGAPVSGRSGYFHDIIDPSLPPNPRKTILYRPSATEFLAVLATVCEELPPDGVLLVYLSAPGSHCSSEKESGCLLLGPQVNEGSNCIYPSDLVPFTRRPIVLVIDCEQSEVFKVISGSEKGELVAMLLSPSALLPTCSADSSRNLRGSLFTLFLTVPLQAFCMVLGLATDDVELETFDKAEKVLCSALNDWGLALATSEILHPVWTQILCDPFLRRILLRFIFCRAVLTLFAPTYGKMEFVPSSVPCLPESVLPTFVESQTTVLQICSIFGATSSFVFSPEISPVACHLPVTSMDNGHSE